MLTYFFYEIFQINKNVKKINEISYFENDRIRKV